MNETKYFQDSHDTQGIEIVRQGKRWGVRFHDDDEEWEYTHWMEGVDAKAFRRACRNVAGAIK